MGLTALSYAAIIGNREIVALLLEAGADPLHEDWMQASALDYADDDVIFELVSRAMFPDLKTRDQNSLAWVSRHRGQLPESLRKSTLLSSALWPFDRHDRRSNRIRILLSIGADPNERFELDQTPLSRALEFGDLSAARELLEHGADPNARWCNTERNKREYACNVRNGVTPLMFAAEAGSLPAVELLLAFKADKSLTDWAGRRAVHYATTRETWDLTRTAK